MKTAKSRIMGAIAAFLTAAGCGPETPIEKLENFLAKYVWIQNVCGPVAAFEPEIIDGKKTRHGYWITGAYKRNYDRLDYGPENAGCKVDISLPETMEPLEAQIFPARGKLQIVSFIQLNDLASEDPAKNQYFIEYVSSPEHV
ncbi:MAG: hypothetical protein M3O22_08460, partial [Pseudomonadota bacterium]|nr:hypothetical protein [Pseudomonadota bacterium]